MTDEQWAELHHDLMSLMKKAERYGADSSLIHYLDHADEYIDHEAVLRHTDEHGPLCRHEYDVIMRALKKTEGNRSKAMELLGMSRAKFYNRIDKYGIGHKK